MSFGVYKPSQGYWVRVLTAVCAGVLTLAGAVWAWNQAGAVRLPQPTWRMIVTTGQNAPEAGAPVTFVFDAGAGQGRSEIGTGTVVSSEASGPGRVELIVGTLSFDQGEDPSGASGLSTGNRTLPVVNASGIDAFERTYLQGGLAGLVILLGAVLIYFFVAVRKPAVEFLIATDGEMKKVNWSTKREVYGSTVVVIVATFLIAGVLFGIDSVFAQFFKLIGVLQG